MIRHLILVLVVLAGAGIPVQVAANHQLEKAMRSPSLSVCLSFFIGGLAMAALASMGILGRGHLALAASAPWWAWSGGLLSAAVVTASIIALPQSGAGIVIAATVFGQLTAAAVLDHFGWLGVEQIRLNVWRIFGVVLLFGGALLMQHK
jgi:bacterial/archaeal transporter family-2 protein